MRNFNYDVKLIEFKLKFFVDLFEKNLLNKIYINYLVNNLKFKKYF